MQSIGSFKCITMYILRLFIAVLFLSGACSRSNEAENPVPATPQEMETGITYLALGDSYTIGQNVTLDQRWPVLLVKALRNSGKAIKSPEIIATTGWTTGDLLDAVKSVPAGKKYDMVSLLIGVNNQFQGRSIEQYRSEFRQLLVKSIGYTNGDASKVFVLSIPDWGVTPYASGTNRDLIALDIDRFNAAAKEECEKLNIRFVDITPESRKALNDATLVANDRLHFSGKMHQLWVDLAFPVANSIF